MKRENFTQVNCISKKVVCKYLIKDGAFPTEDKYGEVVLRECIPEVTEQQLALVADAIEALVENFETLYVKTRTEYAEWRE